MSIRGEIKRTRISRKKMEAVLFPVATFLNAEGLTRQQVLAVFSAVYDKAQKILRARGFEYVGYNSLHADVVSLWLRHKRFLNDSGKPRVLSTQGKTEFSGLVRLVDPKANPNEVLSVLVRCGNVQRVGKKKYALIQGFFRTDGPKKMALESNLIFLSDFNTMLIRLLARHRSPRLPKPFWRKAETSGLSDTSAKKFITFARERASMFAEELDDWLKANENTQRKTRIRRRVGIGVFSIFSDPESGTNR